MGQSIGIIGAGAWGTAMAMSLARGGHSVQMWALEKDVVESVNNRHENTRYLPGFALPGTITASGDLKAVAADKNFLILASPSIYLERTMQGLLDVPNIRDGTTCIGVLTKGFIPSASGPRLILETLERVLPPVYAHNLVYIAGPSHAEEVAMGKVTGLIAASENPMNSIRFREVLKSKGLLVYSSLDVIGVQICAAAKNVVAIAFGCLAAIAEKSDVFGDNTESLLLAAGLNEIMTIGRAMGATHPETFTSISGVGDLDVTCRSKFGRNQRFGQDIIKNNILDKFENLDDLIARIMEIGYLPEGVVACKFVYELARRENLKLPICSGLYRILNKELHPAQFIEQLLDGVQI
ncbi:MAG TPA: NAD(P)H-dependent glycerol-3-phosphate dehydrogenase [Treponemataceae bacterium]|jgi:glycerol-3-phosphate dehydrogenase (NAD(P)+)|nr:MAG: Glycerol-3-phosphate dehydrogenase (NAD(P)+) [Spirochaetes bacterium ADurb.Bin269]HOC29580.1 NAD(P)H-dependent glycerol-3-phosphate dehydrogenase [Treponemataceae bacterium]HQL33467.1 NAD(P)H-dependent glycerol-3-phosphate dehydrogenase [Treponemataceae bacterium]